MILETKHKNFTRPLQIKETVKKDLISVTFCFADLFCNSCFYEKGTETRAIVANKTICRNSHTSWVATQTDIRHERYQSVLDIGT
jgi:hypothetical protein